MLIYKITPRSEWTDAEAAGTFSGSAADKKDGFIHFSRGGQVLDTLNKWYAGADDLVLVAVDGDTLGAALIYEASREGALFPHLYGTLPLSAVKWVKPIGRNADGTFAVPEECR